jgi:DNA-binding XRE family transcriptional regulator
VTVQIVEIEGQKIALLPIADYERLLDIAHDREDVEAAQLAAQRRLGDLEYLPAAMANRILDGESPLRVWREYRGLSTTALAASVNVAQSHISQLENRKRRGQHALWRKLAEVLKVEVDDILPDS